MTDEEYQLSSDDPSMRAKAATAQKLLDKFGNIIQAALGLYANEMSKATDEAQAGYDRAMADPELKKRQDDSLMTTAGLNYSAELFRQNAQNAHAAMAALIDYSTSEYDNEDE